MKFLKSLTALFISMFFLISTTHSQEQHQVKNERHNTRTGHAHDMGTGSPLDHGTEMLHHMMYEQAADLFSKALEEDPNSAMAYWGIAMTALRPLWAPPNPKEFEKGLAAIEKAVSMEASSAKERETIKALHNYYISAKENGYREGLKVWENSLKALHEKYPDDIEIASFYGLSLLATAPPDDKTYSQQLEAGKLLEELHKVDPQHPGPFHYSIHAYDNPVLAERGIEFANGYEKIAPDVPHALHMPSHIFVRVGNWKETINWNIRSAESALRQPAGDLTSYHHAHALDYLIYAYLQQGRNDKARQVLAELDSVENYQPNFVAAYALAATPARYLVERKKWEEAANIVVDTSEGFPWKDFPQYEAISWWTQGMGAVMNQDTGKAEKVVERLRILEEQTRERKEDYWALIVNTQRKTVEAWILYAKGEYEEAIELMTKAADQEDSVEKHPVTPGNVLPARELLGDMLLMHNKPEEAIAAYEAALEISPNRFNSLFGAGKAAEKAGKNELAEKFYQQLHEITIPAESDRLELQSATAFLQKN